MKKFVCALLAAVLSLSCAVGCFAEEYYTLPEIREQAAEGWHETYTDKYGRTVQVDIDIDVFGEESAPVLEVWLPDYLRYDNTENNPYLTVTNVRKSGGQRTRFCIKRGEKVDLDKAYGADYGNDLTLREAYDYLRELLEKDGIPTEEFLYDQPKEFEMLCNTSQATWEVLSKPFYYITLWQTLHEIPILAHVVDGVIAQGVSPWYRAEMTYMVRDRGEYAIGIHSLVERKMLAEDIPLCSLEQVIENLESEIEEGYIQKVYSLRFGYSLYNEPTNQRRIPESVYDNKEPFYAVPSWVIECIFAEKPGETVLDNIDEEIDERAYAKLMTINAQTGEMIDPFDKSKYGFADADYQGFIPWEDVQ